MNERGFDKTFVQRLTASDFIKQGKPRQDRQTKEWQKPAVLFPWHDEKGEVVGLDQQGTEIDYEKYGKRGTQKKVAAGSDSNYGYNFHTGNGADQLLVFESPIDALSYAQQHFPELAHENATFLSLSGTDHQKVLSQLDRMNQLNGHLPNKLVLATDNDLAGFKAADQFSVLQFEGMENIRQVPTKGKDWNDQLKANDPILKVVTQFKSHFGIYVKSITCDNGKEFINGLVSKYILQHLGDLYIANSYAPYERGTNERTNRNLRAKWYFPKGTRFSDISQQHVDQVVKEINSKPLTHAHKQQKSPQYLFKRATRRLRQRAQRDDQLVAS